MPSAAVPSARDLTPEERRRQVAAILAQGVVRYRRTVVLAEADRSSAPRNTGLELVSETRLSVSVGLADARRAPDSEVNDGRDA
jgi:hypothetical protein